MRRDDMAMEDDIDDYDNNTVGDKIVNKSVKK